MKIGLAPLTVALLTMSARLLEAPVAADLFGLTYLVVASVMIARSRAFATARVTLQAQ